VEEEEEEEAIHLSLSFMVEQKKNNNESSLLSFTWKQSIFFFHLGKQILCFIMWQAKIMKKKKQSIFFSLWKTILCPMWKQQQEKKQSCLFLSCRNDFLSHVEVEKETTIISFAFSLSHVLK
jgi:hypothetical protein